MKTLEFNEKQVTQIVSDLQAEKGDYSELMKIFLEAMMRAERKDYNQQNQDVSNGYRPRRVFGKGRVMELQVPRTRYGTFYPVLLNVLRDQKAEMERLSFSLYTAGLTTQQVGELFDEIYGKHYSKQRVSQLMDYAREEVQGWLDRPLEGYYPIIYVDCTFVPVRRDGMVKKEAFYSILGVRSDRSREVLAVVNAPTESAEEWREIASQIRTRGVRKAGLIVSDGLKGIEDAFAGVFNGTSHQLCVVHLKRQIDKKVHKHHRKQLQEELREVFTTDILDDTPEKGYKRFEEFCERWAKIYPSFKRMIADTRYHLYFTYLGFHYKIRPMIYSTNWIERLNRDYKRVLRMRGALPNEQAVILLMGRVAMSRKAYERKIPKLDYETQKLQWTE